MTEEINISWEEFKTHMDEAKAKGDLKEWSFRGHKDSTWSLETTLERHLIKQGGKSSEEYSYEIFVEKLIECIDQVNKKTNKNFKKFNNQDISQYYYDFIIHMRHHGFPAPILDWTRNWMIAAYFAFSNASVNNNVAIYAYKKLTRLTHNWQWEPYIREYDPKNDSSPRHIVQEARYTTAFLSDDNSNVIRLFPHDRAFIDNKSDYKVVKYILNGSDKYTVLRELRDEGITENYLFPDSDETYIMELSDEKLLLSYFIQNG